jgi:polysaccharide biosynthesis protein PslH
LKVVIVNEGLAYPPTAGNWLRTLNLMLPLASRHEITYVCRGAKDSRANERARSFYAEHGIRALISSDHPAPNRGAAFYGRLVANLFSPFPYSIAAHRSAQVRRTIRELAANEAVDLWQFETISYADTLAPREARTIAMAHNVESLIWKRLYETEANAARRWYIGHQWRKYERFEAGVLRDASFVVAVSAEDAALMRERFGVQNTAVVDNGVDIAWFAEGSSRAVRDRRQVLFLGSLEWRPNLDSVERLLSEIMPAVRAAEPEARLVIVGRNPPASLVRRVRDEPNVELHADVPDVRPYLAAAGMLAVPLRIGGGSRLKILEAIAAGLPVVSTRIGCEGLIFEPGRDLRVVESPQEMAPAIVELMRHPEEGARLAGNGKAVVNAHYDWSRLADRLEQVWFETVRVSAR